MGTKGRILLADIERMLRACAPGAVLQPGKHKIRILWGGKTFPNLPKGEHGKRPGRAEIELGHVRDLATFFGILECAKQHLEILK